MQDKLHMTMVSVDRQRDWLTIQEMWSTTIVSPGWGLMRVALNGARMVRKMPLQPQVVDVILHDTTMLSRAKATGTGPQHGKTIMAVPLGLIPEGRLGRPGKADPHGPLGPVQTAA